VTLFAEISVSLDGYAAGPNQSESQPLGERGEELHEWVIGLKEWREPHGREGGETTPSSAVIAEGNERTAATIMGRNMFGGGPGPWGDDPWQGWWGEDPPFHHPVFVLTHHEREPLVLGETTFTFVTDGIGSAAEQAADAAGERDVRVAGGANAIQQYLGAGLATELDLHLVPILLGAGERLLDNVGRIELEQTRVVEAPGVTHLRYRVSGGG
jgi:dihydrofolate reductase